MPSPSGVRVTLKRVAERLGLVSASFVALVLVSKAAPADRDATGLHFGEATYTVLLNVLATTFSVGLISMIVELFVRQNYAESLRRYLNLSEAAVRADLQGLQPEPYASAGSLLEDASRITAVTRDPRTWVTNHFEYCVRAARLRDTTIKIVVPDDKSPSFATVAATLGMSEGDLSASVRGAVDLIRTRWTGARVPRMGSSVSVVAAAMVTSDLVITDRDALLYVGPAFDHQLGDQRLVLHVGDSDYPGRWLREQADSGEHTGELWAGRGGAAPSDPASVGSPGARTDGAEPRPATEREGKF